MFIRVNSRGLSPSQRACIEDYFKDNFSFEGKTLSLIWQQDDSEFILLGYPYGSSAAPVGRQPGEEFGSIMYRVHENELFEIAGRNVWHLVNDWSQCQSA